MNTLASSNAGFASRVAPTVIDPTVATPARNFGASGTARTVVGLEWTAEAAVADSVYEQASRLAAELDPDSVVLVGRIGESAWLHRWEARFGSSLRVLESPHLVDPTEVERLFEPLTARAPHLIVLYQALEHIADPRPLLRTVRRLLKQHRASRLVVVSSERRRHPPNILPNFPLDPSCFRLWALEEISGFLASSGFSIKRMGHIGGHSTPESRAASYLEASCTEDEYNYFLGRASLPRPSPHLVITTEHASTATTGGIGSYVQELEKVLPELPLLLFVGASGIPRAPGEFIRRQGWISVALSGAASAPAAVDDGRIDPDLVLATVEQIVYLYDGLQSIEYQDYLGIGCRVAQAKRCGLLPDSVLVTVVCHGNQYYLENATGQVFGHAATEILLKEKTSIEEADVVVLPTRFLEDLYLDRGLDLGRASVRRRYPFSYDERVLAQDATGPITTLVFFGKRNAAKGYPEFVRGVEQFFSDVDYERPARQISKVVLLGPSQDSRRPVLPAHVEVVETDLDRPGALAALRDMAPHALVVLPYRADNHPVSVLEVANVPCQFLASATGGIPELVPAAHQADVLCPASADGIARGLARALSMSVPPRTRLVNRLKEDSRHEQEAINSAYRSGGRARAATGRTPVWTDGDRSSPITVIVPTCNMPLRLVADMIFGLNNQSLPPHEVIVVDDGSEAGYAEQLRLLLEAKARFRFRLIVCPENRGLAAARIVALRLVATPFVCAHDADNIARNDLLYRGASALRENPDVAAVTFAFRTFRDGASWLGDAQWLSVFTPLVGSVCLGQSANIFGDALAVYRVEALRQAGGWDESSAAIWEDWALFVRLTSQGRKVLACPWEGFLYRHREESLSRTQPAFPGWIRIARTATSFFDGMGLLRMVHEFGRLRDELLSRQAEVAGLTAEIRALQHEREAHREASRAAPVNPVRGERRGAGFPIWGRALVDRTRELVRKLQRPADRDIRRAGLFDAAWYLENNPDVAATRVDPFDHFLDIGWREGRDPGPGFDTSWYLEQNPDVAAADLNPLVHFIQHGRWEGRVPMPPPTPSPDHTVPARAAESHDGADQGPWEAPRFSTAAWLEAQRERLLLDNLYLAGLAADHTAPVMRVGRGRLESVSVVVTCMNKASVLPVVIERLGQQTRRPDMVILVDDGSHDGSVDKFLRAGERARLRCAYHVMPPGQRFRINSVRNRGFEMAADGLVLVVDGDMVVSPLFVERHLTMHEEAGTPIVSVGPRFEYAFPDRSGPVNFMWGQGEAGQPLAADQLVPSWVYGHGAFGVRRAVWEAIGKFDARYDGNYGIDDLDFLFRLFLCGVYQKCDFEAYVIHIPHRTAFRQDRRDVSVNEKKFSDKFGVPLADMADRIDYGALSQRESYWADDYQRFLRTLAHREPDFVVADRVDAAASPVTTAAVR